MKELIELYKKKVKNIEQFLNELENGRAVKTIARTRERAHCYRTFITELERIEREAKPKDDFTLFDLSGIPAQEKDILINDFSILTSTNALKVYKSLGLKVGFEVKMHNDPTNEDFVLSFKKIERDAQR